MTDESAFHAMLDADPTNSGCRLVFADWLEEQGDWRATGMRWMGENGKWPLQTDRPWVTDPRWWRWADEEHYGVADPNAEHCEINARIPCLLLRRITECDDKWETDHIAFPLRSFRTRRAAELALCRALTPTCRRCLGTTWVVRKNPHYDGTEDWAISSPCPDCAERLVTT